MKTPRPSTKIAGSSPVGSEVFVLHLIPNESVGVLCNAGHFGAANRCESAERALRLPLLTERMRVFATKL